MRHVINQYEVSYINNNVVAVVASGLLNVLLRCQRKQLLNFFLYRPNFLFKIYARNLIYYILYFSNLI